jgi:hypothetical protein
LSQGTKEPLAAVMSLGFSHDELVVAMVDEAADYFLDGSIAGSEPKPAFLALLDDWYGQQPTEMRMKFAGGLLVAHFDLAFDPLVITPPAQPASEVLDPNTLMINGDHVAPTILDMGYWALAKNSPGYDAAIAEVVFAHVDLAPRADLASPL